MGRRFQNYTKPKQITFQFGDKRYVLRIEKEKFTNESLDVLEEIEKLNETDQPYIKKRKYRSRAPRKNDIIQNETKNNEANAFDFMSNNDFASTPNVDYSSPNQIEGVLYDSFESDPMNNDFIWTSMSDFTFGNEEQILWDF
ncbi:hypothetical protein GPJ56_001855 [Histomonas meleagridis]|uniref:uncharacterized protein n=1 Tax=Histomonas meleagridis TaxID=135588 RepID=UPI003559887B|nr:hypothetical protein GPJ56_001855 [Histomonas meleagridis]KAH0803207.1 hypothetical protein GO595_003943 [Histomonas meleagridis]